MAFISIHAPREGGDFTASNKNAAESLFQSTPPARGATNFTRQTVNKEVFQSTPPARGATG